MAVIFTFSGLTESGSVALDWLRDNGRAELADDLALFFVAMEGQYLEGLDHAFQRCMGTAKEWSRYWPTIRQQGDLAAELQPNGATLARWVCAVQLAMDPKEHGYQVLALALADWFDHPRTPWAEHAQKAPWLDMWRELRTRPVDPFDVAAIEHLYVQRYEGGELEGQPETMLALFRLHDGLFAFVTVWWDYPDGTFRGDGYWDLADSYEQLLANLENYQLQAFGLPTREEEGEPIDMQGDPLTPETFQRVADELANQPIPTTPAAGTETLDRLMTGSTLPERPVAWRIVSPSGRVFHVLVTRQQEDRTQEYVSISSPGEDDGSGFYPGYEEFGLSALLHFIERVDAETWAETVMSESSGPGIWNIDRLTGEPRLQAVLMSSASYSSVRTLNRNSFQVSFRVVGATSSELADALRDGPDGPFEELAVEGPIPFHLVQDGSLRQALRRYVRASANTVTLLRREVSGMRYTEIVIQYNCEREQWRRDAERLNPESSPRWTLTMAGETLENCILITRGAGRPPSTVGQTLGPGGVQGDVLATVRLMAMRGERGT